MAKKVKKLKNIPFSSNAVRLSISELVIAALIVIVGLFFLAPFAWSKIEKIEFKKDFRLASDSRDDYWIYKKWADNAVDNYPALFIGDSVVWGMFVDDANTLPSKLNKRLGKDAVANLAIDGLHSVAMKGLLDYYGGSIKNKKVILHFNPLWLNSKKYDLSGDDEMRVHHPRLIPQFSSDLKCYTEEFSTRMSVLQERNIPFFSLLNHIRLSFFDNEEFRNWIIDNPYKNPLSQISMSIDAAEGAKENDETDWTKRGIGEQDWDWASLDSSKQWNAFKDIVRSLKANNNDILVMVGPLNPHMQTAESLKKFRNLQKEVTDWLKKEAVNYELVKDIPSEQYADASHPLDKGYDLIADQLIQNDFFKSLKGE